MGDEVLYRVLRGVVLTGRSVKIEMEEVPVIVHFAGPLMRGSRWSPSGQIWTGRGQGRPWTWATIKVREEDAWKYEGDSNPWFYQEE